MASNDYTFPARVKSHEGRHRVAIILELDGDDPIEVHLLFHNDLRRRHITPEVVKALNQRLIPEGSNVPIEGPFFDCLIPNYRLRNPG